MENQSFVSPSQTAGGPGETMHSNQAPVMEQPSLGSPSQVVVSAAASTVISSPEPSMPLTPEQHHSMLPHFGHNDQPSAGLPALGNTGGAAEVPFSQDDQPVAVVKALSVRGLEYAMMSMTLWLASGALTFIALLIINGGTSFTVLAFPIALLVVAAPIFAYFFLRLKRAELAVPALRFDPSKRHLSQITQLFTFTAALISLIGIVYTIIAKIGGALNAPMGKTLLNLFIILLITGGLFAYYWRDEHKRI